MFGLRTKKAETTEVAAVGPLDRIDRRTPAEPRPAPGPADRDVRMTAASAGLRDAVAPRLRTLVQAGTPAGEVTRQATTIGYINAFNLFLWTSLLVYPLVALIVWPPTGYRPRV